MKSFLIFINNSNITRMKNKFLLPVIDDDYQYSYLQPAISRAVNKNTAATVTTADANNTSQVDDSSGTGQYGGFKSQVAWGGHLVHHWWL